MRTYLVVIDESDEARAALRFAARRAARTGGAVEILALVTPTGFVEWGGVQAAMEEEARLGVEALVAQVAGELVEEMGVKPVVTVRHGEPIATVRTLLKERPTVAALVLGAAAGGPPGELVQHFAGEAGAMPCPLMVIPGGLNDEALDRVS